MGGSPPDRVESAEEGFSNSSRAAAQADKPYVKRSTGRGVGLVLIATVCLSGLGGTAHAVDWPNRLSKGDRGKYVRRLQMRVAGWFPERHKTRFHIDGSYGKQTQKAVTRFERNYGFPNPNGAAGRETFAVLERLAQRDGSTKNFDWSEFAQRSNSGCSAQANAYAGTFNGGRVSKKRTKRNVRRLMWRLEALRKKSGGNAIGINSGFRSVPYNSCIGGASASQHLYGTAADNRVGGITNDKARRIAKRSQFHGISCYSNTTHNHFDLRLENSDLPSAQFWYWPEVDGYGRELDDSGRPCWGESVTRSSSLATADAEGVPATLVPTTAEVRAFEEAGESDDLAGAD